VQRVRPVAEPPGSARPGWRVLADLSTRVGLASGFESADDVLEEIGRAAPAYGGLDRRALNQAWGVLVEFDGKAGRPPLPQREGSSPRPAPGTRLLALDGVMDWGADPLVASAPTLCREHLARRKLFPNGLVEMSASDAEALGVRAGWMVRVTSAQGSATLPAVLRRELPQGLLLVPFAFRGSAAGVLGGLDVIAVQVEPA
jgi:predicted molibdopterin-dependent oxidoreductase YjgC